ncbi:MAG: formate--tetrahydrofolate ligase [Myxococcota bacterium]|nr:formate--tetrahydrofolate ligase [Myxococcota bacterium]
MEDRKLVMDKSDIEIARAASPLAIADVAAKLDIPEPALVPYGRTKAKIGSDFLESLPDAASGKLILVTAISPTPAGEGKTTTSVGLTDGLCRLGKRAMVCLREPSLGPCFGKKGGAAGGGYAQVIPMEDINLHFTGDFHAIGAANNLLAALIDNHINWGNALDIDPRRITWRRVVDMNDRALRQVNVSLGGLGNGFPREDGYDITVASEIMAIFCLAEDLVDLQRRLGNIIIGYDRGRRPITARDLSAEGALTALLRDALEPNLVQTLENNPAIVHGGPFANIAHGCNSVVATKASLKLADYVVTEAGFGADLGAEKFFNIKCRKANLRPDAAVLVATVRALKMHGGVSLEDLEKENVDAVRRGCANLARHLRNLRTFGMPVVVAVNRFTEDTNAELDMVRATASEYGSEVVVASHWADGGEGAEDLARSVVDLVEYGQAQFAPLYPDDLPLWQKIRTIATHIYEAEDIMADQKVRNQVRRLEELGYGHLPICMAKTQYSFSTDPQLKGAPSGHQVPIREVRLLSGAEFVVVICGDIMTMPGLPRVPAANSIRVNEEGEIEGLF